MKAVIFDLDDTLFDHTTSASTAVRRWIAELGVDCSDELLARWFEIEQTVAGAEFLVVVGRDDAVGRLLRLRCRQ